MINCCFKSKTTFIW